MRAPQPVLPKRVFAVVIPCWIFPLLFSRRRIPPFYGQPCCNKTITIKKGSSVIPVPSISLLGRDRGRSFLFVDSKIQCPSTTWDLSQNPVIDRQFPTERFWTVPRSYATTWLPQSREFRVAVLWKALFRQPLRQPQTRFWRRPNRRLFRLPL